MLCGGTQPRLIDSEEPLPKSRDEGAMEEVAERKMRPRRCQRSQDQIRLSGIFGKSKKSFIASNSEVSSSNFTSLRFLLRWRLVQVNSGVNKKRYGSMFSLKDSIRGSRSLKEKHPNKTRIGP